MDIAELFKNITSALGLILSASSVFALCSKGAKKAIGNFFKKYGDSEDIADVKKALDDIKERLDSIDDANAITVDFTREQCRSMIKDMFYKYCDEKKLPLYEYKLLLKLEHFYINRLHGNTFIVVLINKMKTGEIDYDEHSIEDN